MTTETLSNPAWLWKPSANLAEIYTPDILNIYSDVGGVSFGYDQKGNLTDDGANSLGYDPENRLVSVFTNQIASIGYAYDPFGRRVEKDVDGVVTRFLYDGASVIAEYDDQGAIFGVTLPPLATPEPRRATRDRRRR